MRRFKFQMLNYGNDVEVGDEGIIEIDQSVIDYAYTDEYKENFHKFDSDDEIVSHIVYNFIVNRISLSTLEGFMMDDGLAKIVDYPFGYDNFGVRSEELGG